MLRVSIGVNPVEDRADDMEIAVEVRAGVDDEDPNAIANGDLQHALLVLERAAVEDDLTRILGLLRAPVGRRGEQHADLGGVARLRVELALYQHELLVGFGTPAVL